jgi:hypothetical protein
MATTFDGGADTILTTQTESFLLQIANIKIKGDSIIDLVNVLVEIEVFEDIFKSSLTGSITINDFVGGFEKFVLTGGERITLKIAMPGTGNLVTINRDDLIVHEFSKIKASTTSNLQYKLYFASEASLNSHKKRIFRSFGTERNLENIIGQLYETVGNRSKIKIDAPQTYMSSQFLSPGYTPIDAINSIAKRAATNGVYHVFYERLSNNMQGESYHHYFTSINGIFLAANTNLYDREIPQILYSPVGATFTTTYPEFNIRAKTVEFQNNYNHLSSMIGGFYNSRVRSLDILSRRYTNTKISYNELNQLGQLDYAYSNKFLDEKNFFSTYDSNDFPGERLIVSPINDAFKQKSTWIKNETLGGFLNSSIRVNVDIAGGTNRLGVGDVIDLKLPSRANHAVNLENPIVPNDIVYSGKYIITACRHTITRLGYTKKLELSRGNMRFNLDQLIAIGKN